MLLRGGKHAPDGAFADAAADGPSAAVVWGFMGWEEEEVVGGWGEDPPRRERMRPSLTVDWPKIVGLRLWQR